MFCFAEEAILTNILIFSFGSGLAGSRTGIIFNSGMDDFSYPQQSNYFNLPPSPVNYIQPLKQAVTSMAPVIITDNFGKVKIVIGAAGGAKIISSVVQVRWPFIICEHFFFTNFYITRLWSGYYG